MARPRSQRASQDVSGPLRLMGRPTAGIAGIAVLRVAARVLLISPRGPVGGSSRSACFAICRASHDARRGRVSHAASLHATSLHAMDLRVEARELLAKGARRTRKIRELADGGISTRDSRDLVGLGAAAEESRRLPDLGVLTRESLDLVGLAAGARDNGQLLQRVGVARRRARLEAVMETRAHAVRDGGGHDGRGQKAHGGCGEMHLDV